MVDEKTAGKHIAAFALYGNLDVGARSDWRNVGRWMRGMPVERPSKYEFDRVYSQLADQETDYSDTVAEQVEKAAIRAGREEHRERIRATPEWKTHPIDLEKRDDAAEVVRARGGYHVRYQIAWANEVHRRGHHQGPCDASCRRGARMHAHRLMKKQR